MPDRGYVDVPQSFRFSLKDVAEIAQDDYVGLMVVIYGDSMTAKRFQKTGPEPAKIEGYEWTYDKIDHPHKRCLRSHG